MSSHFSSSSLIIPWSKKPSSCASWILWYSPKWSTCFHPCPCYSLFSVQQPEGSFETMSDRVTFLLRSLHWLSISFKLQPKVLRVAHKALTYQISHYLSNLTLLQLTPFQTLCFIIPVHLCLRAFVLQLLCLPFSRKPCGSCFTSFRSVILNTQRLLFILSNLFIHPIYCPSSLLKCKLPWDSNIICCYSLLYPQCLKWCLKQSR